MKTIRRNLTKENSLEAIAVIVKSLEDAQIIREGEEVSFQLPEALQKAVDEGVDIYKLSNLTKVLNVQITGEPEQVLYSYKIIAGQKKHEVKVTAIEFLYFCKMWNRNFDF